MYDRDGEHHNCEHLMREGQRKRCLMKQGYDAKDSLQRYCGSE